ncbi:MAG: SH3 domain-containing protein [Phascolarctobacterium sp.]|nr:SH3 domain-containing protein [Phascolarctobacterium sp.]
MLKSIKKTLAICAGLVMLSSVQICLATGITTQANFISPDFWNAQNPNADSLILDEKGVADLNKRIINETKSVYNLAVYPQTLTSASVKTKIMDYSLLEDDLYLRGNKVSDNYKGLLREQTNVSAIPANVKVQYAVTVRRTPVRNLPTGESLFYYAGDTNFDVLQETMLDPGEPLAVLHQSANKYFYYVQAKNYAGWIARTNLAMTDRKTWLEYVEPKKFLVVTGKELVLKTGAEQVLYQQGSVLPLTGEVANSYIVTGPVRNKQGMLQKENLSVLKANPNVHKGYLPYTSKNLINAAFKFYNSPYGWGGMKDSVDCSSLLFNVYRTVGIYLPRNADEQETTAGAMVNLEGMTTEQRKVQLGALIPGAALAMPNHILIYLGEVNNEAYAIHSLANYVEDGTAKPAMKVVVSDLNLLRGNGDNYLNNITTACEYR